MEINITNTSVPIQQIIIIQKTPEYTKRAQRAYYNRNKDDEEFMKKKTEQTKKWRENNINDYNERQKLIMRERRAKAKVAKAEELKKLEAIVEKAK